MHRREMILGTAVLLMAGGCQPEGAPTLAPAALPADLAFQTPGADVPPEAARFWGRWEGTWGTALDGKLAVLTMEADGTFTGVYAWGDHPEGRFASGLLETTGQVADGELRLKAFGNGAEVSYIFLETGAIEGRYLLEGDLSRGRFTRAGPV